VGYLKRESARQIMFPGGRPRGGVVAIKVIALPGVTLERAPWSDGRGRVMATVKPIKPKKPVDYVGYEPVMLTVSKARAAQHLVEFLNSGHQDAMDFKSRVKDHVDWIRQIGPDALTAAFDEIETEHRKLGTNLLQKEATPAEVERLLRPPDPEAPKDGASWRRRDDPIVPSYDSGLTPPAKLLLLTECGVAREEMTVGPEDTLCAAGISGKHQARYQRRMSNLLAGGRDGDRRLFPQDAHPPGSDRVAPPDQ